MVLTISEILCNSDLMPRKRFLIYVNLLVDSIGWSLIIPTLPYIHASFGISNLQVGMISSILAVMIFIFGTLQGRASDYFGRVRMLQLSAASQFLGHSIIIYAIHSKSVVLFVVARCLPAMFKCGMVVSQALLYDVSDESDVARNIASLMAYSNISFIIGPILGGEIYAIDPLLPFYLGCVISILNLSLLSYLEQLLKLQPNMHRKKSISNSNLTSVTGNLNNAVMFSTIPVNINGSGLTRRNISTNNAQHGSSLSETVRHKPISASRSNIDASSSKSFGHLLQYLHIRFAFQLNNSLLESLFAQHGKNTLQLSGSSIGRFMACSSLLSAFTNAVIMKKLLLVTKLPERLLIPLTLGITVGLYGWVFSTNLAFMAVSIAMTSLCSNLFLNIIQSIIAQSQKAMEIQQKMESKRQTSAVNLAHISHIEAKSSKISLADMNIGKNETLGPLVDDITAHNREEGNGDDDDGLVEVTEGDIIRLRCMSSDSIVYANSYVDVDVVTGRDLYAPQIDTIAELSCESRDSRDSSSERGTDSDKISPVPTEGSIINRDNDVTAEIGDVHTDISVKLVSEVMLPEIDCSSSVRDGSSSTHATSPTPSHSGIQSSSGGSASSEKKNSIGVVFGMSSTTDRAARIVSPILGGVFMQYYGNMGLIYVISFASLYCIVLSTFYLPERKHPHPHGHGGATSPRGSPRIAAGKKNMKFE